MYILYIKYSRLDWWGDLNFIYILSAITQFGWLILSISVGIVGGWLGGLSVGVPTSQFVGGIQYEFIPFYITYALIKSIFFAFIITSVSAYYGYHASGGAINVGKSSTKAVVYSSILILIFNYILTDLILAW